LIGFVDFIYLGRDPTDLKEHFRILFNMYLNDLPHVANADLTVTYADDTYVILNGEHLARMRTKTREYNFKSSGLTKI